MQNPLTGALKKRRSLEIDEQDSKERYPWPALKSFTKNDRDKFFGRDDDLARLRRNLRGEITTILFGQSGLGKTSLIQAALIYDLEKTDSLLPIDGRLTHREDSPSLMVQLRDALISGITKADLFEPVLPEEDEDIWSYLHRREVSFLHDDGHDVKPLLIFDQFEEIFTNGQSTPKLARRSREFFECLVDLVQGRMPPDLKDRIGKEPTLAKEYKSRRHDYHILIVLREDYLPHLDTAADRFVAPDLFRNRQRLLPFTGEQALQAVEMPGRGLLSSDVGEEIVRRVAAARQRQLSVEFLGEHDEQEGGGKFDLSELRVEPALLSLLCSRLNEERIRQRKEIDGDEVLISIGMLETMGDRVLESFYEDSLRGLPQSETVAKFVEEDLLSEGGNYRQQVVYETAIHSLEEGGLTSAQAEESIQYLVKQRRLLRIEDRGDVPRVELSHDVLCDVVCRSRDLRRNRSRWYQIGRQVATLVAGLMLLVAVGMAIFAWDKKRETDVAIQDLVDQQEETEKEKGRTEEALGNWYLSRIHQETKSGNSDGAFVLFAAAAQKTGIGANSGVGYLTQPAFFNHLAKVTLPEGVRKIQWGFTEVPTLFGMTAEGHVFSLNVATREVQWLERESDARQVKFSKLQTESVRWKQRRAVASCFAITSDGVAVGFANRNLNGVARLVTEGEAAEVFPVLDQGVTALECDPHTDRIWAGLACGLTVKLDPNNLGQPDPGFDPFLERGQKDFLSSVGTWKIQGETEDSANALLVHKMGLELVIRHEGQPISTVDEVCFAPDESYVFILTSGELWYSSLESSSLNEWKQVEEGIVASTMVNRSGEVVALSADRMLHRFLMNTQVGRDAIPGKPFDSELVSLHSNSAGTELLLIEETEGVYEVSSIDLAALQTGNRAFPKLRIPDHFRLRALRDNTLLVGEAKTAEKSWNEQIVWRHQKDLKTLATEPVNLSELAHLLDGIPIRGLRLDAQGRGLAMANTAGRALLDADRGDLYDGMFLSWKSSSPETLSSSYSPGSSTLFTYGEGGFQILGFEPYLDFQRGSSITQANREASNLFSDEMTAFASHPGYRFSLTGFSNGEITLVADPSLPQGKGEQEILRIRPFEEAVTSISFSADGSYVSASSEAGEIRLWAIPDDPLPSMQVSSVIDESELPHVNLAWKNEKELFFTDGAVLWFVSAEDFTRRVHVIPGVSGDRALKILDIHHHESRVYALVQSGKSEILTLEVETGDIITRGVLEHSKLFSPSPPLYQRLRNFTEAQMSADGQLWFLEDNEGNAEFWKFSAEWESMRPVTMSETTNFAPHSAVLAPDGQRAIVQTNDEKTWLIWFGESVVMQELSVDARIIFTAFVPDSDAVLIASERGLFWVRPEEDAAGERFLISDEVFSRLAISPQGEFAVCFSRDNGYPQILDVEKRKLIGLVAHTPDALARRLAFSPSASRIGFVGIEGKLRFRSATVPQALAEVEAKTGLTLDANLNVIENPEMERPDTEALSLRIDHDLAKAWREITRSEQILDAFLTDSGANQDWEKYVANLAFPEGENLPSGLRFDAGRLQELRNIESVEGFRYGIRRFEQVSQENENKLLETMAAQETGVNLPPALRGRLIYDAALDELNQTLVQEEPLIVDGEGETLSDTALAAFETFSYAVQEALRLGYTDDYVESSETLESVVSKRINKMLEATQPIKYLRETYRLAKMSARISPNDSSVQTSLGLSASLISQALRRTPDADEETVDEARTLREESTRYYRKALQLNSWSTIMRRNYAFALEDYLENFLKEASDAERNHYYFSAIALARGLAEDPGEEKDLNLLKGLTRNEEEEIMAAEKILELREEEGKDRDVLFALHDLGTEYMEAKRYDEGITTFRRALDIDQNDVYSLVEIGEMKRAGGYPLESIAEEFQRAFEIDEKKERKNQDKWGRRKYGLSFEQFARLDDAMAEYVECYEINLERRTDVTVVSDIARIHLMRGEWPEAKKRAEEAIQKELWGSLQTIASQTLLHSEERAEQAREWLTRALTETENSPRIEWWRTRSLAFASLGESEKAMEAIGRFSSGIAEADRDAGDLREIHRHRSYVLSQSQPKQAIYELALAVSHGWQDISELMIADVPLMSRLESEAAFQTLLGALRLQADQPDRYVELARFLVQAELSKNASWQTDPNTEEVDLVAAAAKRLADALERGLSPDAPSLNDADFAAVRNLPEWEDIRDQAVFDYESKQTQSSR